MTVVQLLTESEIGKRDRALLFFGNQCGEWEEMWKLFNNGGYTTYYIVLLIYVTNET